MIKISLNKSIHFIQVSLVACLLSFLPLSFQSSGGDLNLVTGYAPAYSLESGAECYDGVDNDSDGTTDCGDSECRLNSPEVCDACNMTDCNDNGGSVGSACTVYGVYDGTCYAGENKLSGACTNDCLCLYAFDAEYPDCAGNPVDGAACTTVDGDSGVCESCNAGKCTCRAAQPIDLQSADCPCMSTEEVEAFVTNAATEPYTCYEDDAYPDKCAVAYPGWVDDYSGDPGRGHLNCLSDFFEDSFQFVIDRVNNECRRTDYIGNPFGSGYLVESIIFMTNPQESACIAAFDTLNSGDLCPADPDKDLPGICGCGVADTDSDGDGTADCNDLCASDPGKTDPGQCGCGVADTDSDGDGVADCVDNCPDTANPDQADSDGNGVGDACQKGKGHKGGGRH